MNYPQSLINLIDQLKTLPGIGPKSAERIAFHLLNNDSTKLSQAIIELKNKIRYCTQCFNLTEKELCRICTDPKRDKNTICVVENPKDIQSIEKTRRYNGLYHVLLGKISPLDGIGPDKIKIKELLQRVKKQQEIIIATSSDIEGETTALYLAKALKPTGTKITRIAYGIPAGISLEFADEITLMRSLEGRQVFS